MSATRRPTNSCTAGGATRRRRASSWRRRSGPLRAPSGYYIARVNSRSPARGQAQIADARTRELVRQDFVSYRFLNWANDVLAKAEIKRRQQLREQAELARRVPLEPEEEEDEEEEEEDDVDDGGKSKKQVDIGR